ncbi:MAG: hypothetical protein ACJAVN_001542 [Roseivirga sp.]|jgi:hypothetical protein
MINSEKYRHAEFISGSKVSLEKTLKQVQGDAESGFTLANSLLISQIGRHAEFSSVSKCFVMRSLRQVKGDGYKLEVSL